ncbi:hypothetical protein L2E82_03137 [Cichorium intybus]|uniref:Uncharacterized protein n=1 Tax=Cichorium intybus TaxID=13427 RepID=A0ACB9H4Q0_CICIN|nr:hypothetical protein L2E82_03137 [Cichorium intybus]
MHGHTSALVNMTPLTCLLYFSHKGATEYSIPKEMSPVTKSIKGWWGRDHADRDDGDGDYDYPSADRLEADGDDDGGDYDYAPAA